MMLSPVIVGLFWKYILANNWGIINYYIRTLLHIPEVLWLSDLKFGFWAITIVDIWMWDSLHDAAVPCRSFPPFRITCTNQLKLTGHPDGSNSHALPSPWLLLLVMLAVVFRVIDCFKTVDIVWVFDSWRSGEFNRDHRFHYL